MQGLMVDLLKADDVDVIQVESRAKTVASFADKIRRKGRTDADPLNSITDLVGLRVITYYLDDVDRIGRLIEREFLVDSNNSMDKAEGLASDQFGYRSAHYVTRLRPSRAGLIEWRGFAQIPIEFQVRTSLQHAWAAVSHKLEYKAAEEAPASLRRRLVRLSALFEIADDQFAALRDERDATYSAYRENVTQGRLADVPVDTSSLAAYWTLSDKGPLLRGVLKGNGFTLEDEKPVDEERLVKDRADLVRVLRESGLETLAALDVYLASVERLVPLMKAVRDEEPEQGKGPRLAQGSMDDSLTELLVMDMDKVDTLGASIYTEDIPPRFRSARDSAIKAGFIPREPAPAEGGE